MTSWYCTDRSIFHTESGFQIVEVEAAHYSTNGDFKLSAANAMPSPADSGRGNGIGSMAYHNSMCKPTIMRQRDIKHVRAISNSDGETKDVLATFHPLFSSGRIFHVLAIHKQSNAAVLLALS